MVRVLLAVRLLLTFCLLIFIGGCESAEPTFDGDFESYTSMSIDETDKTFSFTSPTTTASISGDCPEVVETIELNINSTSYKDVSELSGSELGRKQLN